MSLTPSQAEQEVLAETLRRDGSSMTGRQLFAALVPALLFGNLFPNPPTPDEDNSNRQEHTFDGL